MGDIRFHNINRYRENYGLTTFLESGTFQGDAVSFAVNSFDDVRSIEIEKRHFDNACKKFSGLIKTGAVKLYHGNSFDVLHDILGGIGGNILFWLDAHFPGADDGVRRYDSTEDMEVRMPLQRELSVIKKLRKNNKDVIILDDLWMYNTRLDFEWGKLDNHLRSINAGVTRDELVGDSSIDDSFMYDMFSETHDLRIDFKHQGYMIMTPKVRSS